MAAALHAVGAVHEAVGETSAGPADTTASVGALMEALALEKSAGAAVLPLMAVGHYSGIRMIHPNG
jgi:hypothetical protein